ncbi:hypothetical protein KC361_g184 [Hortaea werneckii]|nr:hypothetical protein KC361_g184 [Hortaea werneckii]
MSVSKTKGETARQIQLSALTRNITIDKIKQRQAMAVAEFVKSRYTAEDGQPLLAGLKTSPGTGVNSSRVRKAAVEAQLGSERCGLVELAEVQRSNADYQLNTQPRP